jgi:hypothetical protein
VTVKDIQAICWDRLTPGDRVTFLQSCLKLCSGVILFLCLREVSREKKEKLVELLVKELEQEAAS